MKQKYVKMSERRTFRELYKAALDTLTPVQAFVAAAAEATRRSARTVQAWIWNDRTPDPLDREALTAAFGVPMEELFPGAEGAQGGFFERLERIERLVRTGFKEALYVREAAASLGVSESRMRHLAQGRTMPYYKRERRTYFRKSELEAWLPRELTPSDGELAAQRLTMAILKGMRS